MRTQPLPDRIEDAHRLLAETPGSLIVAIAGDPARGRADRRVGVGLALVRAVKEHLRRQGARRITALVGYEDNIASAFWESAGYPRDREIGRRVRNL